jgi:hypothetical protein
MTHQLLARALIAGVFIGLAATAACSSGGSVEQRAEDAAPSDASSVSDAPVDVGDARDADSASPNAMAGACGATRWNVRYGSGAGDASTATQTGYAIAADPGSNVVSTGVYFGATDFGGGPQPTGGANPSAFLAKLDSAGRYVWSKGFGNPESASAYQPMAQGYAVATDADANVVVGGTFAGPIDFGGGPLQSAGVSSADAGAGGLADASGLDCGTGVCSADAFVAKFDGSGAYGWSHAFGSQGADTTRAVAFDAQGNVYAAGSFQVAIDLGGPTLPSAGDSDAWVAKLDPQGNLSWGVRFGGAGDDAAESVAVDAAGDVVVSGVFVGSVPFGAVSLTTTAAFDGFVAKLDASDGHVLWAKSTKASIRGAVQSVVVDGQDAAILSGIYQGTIDWGAGPIPSAGGWDTFVAKLDTNGNTTWVKSYGGPGDDIAGPIAVDSTGRIVVVGQTKSPGGIDFGGGPVGAATGAQLFIAQLDGSSAHLCSRAYGAMAAAYGVAVDGAGNVLATGEFQGQVDLGLGPLVATGAEQDAFVGAFAP